MSNPRVCIVSPLFHPNIGGPARQAYTMAGRLKQRGLALIVITRRLDIEIPELNGAEVYSVRSLAPERYTLSEFTFVNFLISLSFSIGVMVRLFCLKKRYDIVHFYGASLPLLLSLPLLRMLRKKTVAKISGANPGMEVGSLDDSIFKSLMKGIFFLSDRFIVMSNDLRRRILAENFSDNKIIKIPNGVDEKIFYPMKVGERERLRKKLDYEGKVVFLYSGRLVKNKGLELGIIAAAEVVKTNKNFLLVFLGRGELEKGIKKIAEELGLEGFVRFEGLVNNVAEYLNASDIFIFPSLSEGMPNALLEAMACGLPVIASNIGGVIDILEDGKSGILFEAGNVLELASAMTMLLEAAALRQKLGAEARKRIVENFSIDMIAGEYIKVYRNVLNIGEF